MVTCMTLQAHFLCAKAGTAIARLSHRNSLHLSIRLSVTRVDQSKMMQARITKSSPSAAWKTLVCFSINLKGVTLSEGAK